MEQENWQPETPPEAPLENQDKGEFKK